jgi:threonine dehydratase
MRTPLRRSDWLSTAAAADVYLKLETLQPTFSFKIRGAWNALLARRERGTVSTLVTASAGNHGRGLARAARETGVNLEVFVPETTPRIKLDAIRAAGASVHVGGDYDAAERRAKEEAQRSGAIYLSPYSDPDVIAGAATIGREILHDLPDVETIIAPVGGGGLLSGLALAVRGANVAVIGVEAAASTPFTRSLREGHIVPITVLSTLADGLAGNLDPDTITFDIVRRLVHEIVVVSEDEIREGIRGLIAGERLIAEGAAATAVAAVLCGRLTSRPQKMAVVLSGANIDPEMLKSII